MKIAAYMVIRNDAYYVTMALRSILPHVALVYIQDQFSNDGTYERIVGLKGSLSPVEADKIYVEQIDTGHASRFEKDYNEPYWRSKAVKTAEDLLNSAGWILKIDGDEIFTEHFFNSLAALEAAGALDGINAVRVAGDRFISKTHRSVHPTSIEISPAGNPFVDPHTQLWRANQGVKYIKNPAFERFHPILWPDPQPQLWLDGICNIHLHRTFGPKAVAFWAEGPDVIDLSKPLYPPTSCPNWFNSSINMGNSEEVSFDWPSYVIERWSQWEAGVW